MRRTIRLARFASLCLSLALAAVPAFAALPDAATLLADLGLSPAEIAQVEAGQIVHHEVAPASERELTAGLAFAVSAAPAALVGSASNDLLDRVDPNVIAYGVVSGDGSLADFAKLTFGPDGAARAKAYTTATPAGDLNLSTEEIAAFAKLGADASVASVEQQVRTALLARLQAYRAKGLAGIAPYARSSGERSAAEELRTATAASKPLGKYAPAAFQALSAYPAAKPPGTREAFRWTHFEAHGVPTLSLTHVMLIPDGDGWIFLQRQFYVSTGYNAEQAVAAFLPAQSGSIVVYGNRTSTDQITGFGGGTKRSIGSKMLVSQLESIFERARKAVK